MMMKDPTLGTGRLLPPGQDSLGQLLLSLNPEDKRAMARKSDEMAREAATPESAALLYELASLMRKRAAAEERAAKAWGLMPGEGLA